MCHVLLRSRVTLLPSFLGRLRAPEKNESHALTTNRCMRIAREKLAYVSQATRSRLREIRIRFHNGEVAVVGRCIQVSTTGCLLALLASARSQVRTQHGFDGILVRKMICTHFFTFFICRNESKPCCKRIYRPVCMLMQYAVCARHDRDTTERTIRARNTRYARVRLGSLTVRKKTREHVHLVR